MITLIIPCGYYRSIRVYSFFSRIRWKKLYAHHPTVHRIPLPKKTPWNTTINKKQPKKSNTRKGQDKMLEKFFKNTRCFFTKHPDNNKRNERKKNSLNFDISINTFKNTHDCDGFVRRWMMGYCAFCTNSSFLIILKQRAFKVLQRNWTLSQITPHKFPCLQISSRFINYVQIYVCIQ